MRKRGLFVPFRTRPRGVRSGPVGWMDWMGWAPPRTWVWPRYACITPLLGVLCLLFLTPVFLRSNTMYPIVVPENIASALDHFPWTIQRPFLGRYEIWGADTHTRERHWLIREQEGKKDMVSASDLGVLGKKVGRGLAYHRLRIGIWTDTATSQDNSCDPRWQ